MNRQTLQGFTLLEAIVAMVLIASAGLALFAWINSSLANLARLESRQQQQDTLHQVLAAIELINPMQQPEGEKTLGLYTLRWTAQPIEEPQEGLNSSGYIGYYQVGLYQLTIDVMRHNQSPLNFSVRQVGYQQVRQPEGFSIP